jgi:uncharacterized protein (DUF305 family)
MTINRCTTLPLVALAVTLAALAAGCGGDESGSKSGPGNAADAAFAAGMVPHHEGALEVAEMAQERAEHAAVRRMADGIIRAQKAEISVMQRIAEDLGDMGIGGGHVGMDDEAGPHTDMPMLRSARPFDRAFIDMMVPHHQGAVSMARQQLAEGEHPALRDMAKDIINAQNREIEQMRRWRTRWYASEG